MLIMVDDLLDTLESEARSKETSLRLPYLLRFLEAEVIVFTAFF